MAERREPSLCIHINRAQLTRIFDSLKPSQDVYCALVVVYDDGSEKVVGRTESCKNGNLNPVWNEKFRTTRGRGQFLKFKVYADHLWRSPTFCGEAEFNIDALWQRAFHGMAKAPMPVAIYKKDEQTGMLTISLEPEGTNSASTPMTRVPSSGSGASGIGAPPPQGAIRRPPEQYSAPTQATPCYQAAGGAALGGMIAAPGARLGVTPGGQMSSDGPGIGSVVSGAPAPCAGYSGGARGFPVAADSARPPPPPPPAQGGPMPADPMSGHLEELSRGGPIGYQPPTQLQRQPAAAPMPQAYAPQLATVSEAPPRPGVSVPLQFSLAQPQAAQSPLVYTSVAAAGPPTAVHSSVYATGASGQFWNSFIARG